MSTKLQEKIRCEKEGREFIDNTLSTVGQTPENQHYVKNEVLLAEMMRCIEDDGGKTSEALASMFLQIATKLSNCLKYIDEDDRQDCIYTAVRDCIEYWRSFDPNTTTNAFAYITSICRNGFAKGWRSLGYMKLPQALRMSLSSDNLYSI